jgi:hypothetical protein
MHDIRDEFDPPPLWATKTRARKDGGAYLKRSHLEKRQQWLKDNPTVGNWTTLGMAPNRGHRSVVSCRCSCGAAHEVLLASLKSGASKGCNACRYKRYEDKKREQSKS